jgi:hypothetical protein
VPLVAIFEHLWTQPTEFEVIVVVPASMPLTLPPAEFKVTLAKSDNPSRGALLNAGAAAAGGDILLFLWPDNRLPVEALVTIEKNFSLLPQTLGGNFHVKFNKNTFMTRTAKNFIARQRYGGRYYGNSGIFVQRALFDQLGGFEPLDFLEDYEFGARLETAGPTLYLPDKIQASADKFGLGAAFIWGVVIMLQKLGASPPFLGRVAQFLGWPVKKA